jgi:hypothetical protein
MGSQEGSRAGWDQGVAVSREAILAAGRAFLITSGALVDTCKIEHATGMTQDLTTGVGTPTFTIVYTGQCRIQSAAANWAGPAEVAQAALRLASFELQLPVEGTDNLEIDDLVTVLTCVNDPDLVGRFFHITGVSRKSHATTRKMPLSEVNS